ncbi:Psk1p [Saccharomyces cerevisiae x Saccharomyces kudriavzevii VIN7]|uniref:non-specific serine/threonine protein kinase n=1 Tax=Saccharomyces cerevisiae x Saccharomyces kudriavzevii (strain VIN7) TaxID=1095631 RepID=H0GQU6_SACCK|nr:Psk1p [Saccharomyces cerevisiae x Saccharomyces kudriavzevii VIN7]
MPYIGASNLSEHSFVNLKEKHAIRHKGTGNSSSSLQAPPSPDQENHIDNELGNYDTSLSDVSTPIKKENDSFERSLKDTFASFRETKPPPPLDFEQPRLPSTASSSVDSTVSSPLTDADIEELEFLPNESTHSYSYNPLSPNSLAVRLRILKRSLEIIIQNPSMLLEPTPDDLPPLKEFTSRRRSLPKTSASANHLMNRNKSQIWNTTSATLNAFVNNTSSSSAASSALSKKKMGTPVFPNLDPTHSQTFHRANSLAYLPSISAKRDPLLERNSSLFLGDCGNGISSERPSFRQPFKDKANNVRNSSLLNESTYPEEESFLPHHKPSIDLLNEQRANLKCLLNLLNETLEKNTSERASDLHMISLFNLNKLMLGDPKNSNSERDKRTENLKKILLDSLAEPFFEHYNFIEGNPIEDTDELKEEIDEFTGSGDTTAITEIRPQQDYGRILRTFTSTKNSAPQAIFTCSQGDPWQFRAANDLACLVFGISQSAIRALTLMDLIHTDSRNFVLNKLLSTEGQEMVFTGEIIGIVQPETLSSSKIVWASFWAKRKNDLLVCVFEKVPCDYVDVLLNLDDFSVENIVDKCELLSDGPSLSSSSTLSLPKMTSSPNGSKLEYSLERKVLEKSSSRPNLTNNHYASESELDGISHSESSPSLSPVRTKKSVKFANDIKEVKNISQSLAKLMDDVRNGLVFDPDDDLLPMPIRVCNHINETRYFTLNHLSFNIPCAVSSTVLEDELKLKIHSLPYQAGLFIVDSHTLDLISSNKSILKNMFGYHFAELVGKSITEIIPTFPRILQFINEKYPALDITLHKNKGLVLTEHFFRKIQAEIMDDRKAFYTSVGIDGLHRDGREIKIDFQLRVMNSKVILLWVTHSRDVVFEEYNTNPSQLKMLKESEISLMSSASSSASSSKKSSSRISTGTLKDLSNLSIYEDLDHRANKLKYEIGGESTNHSESTLSERDQDPLEDDKDSSEMIVGDPEMKHKLELAKIYSRDKSQFVKEGNFRVDEDLIISKISLSPSAESLVDSKGSAKGLSPLEEEPLIEKNATENELDESSKDEDGIIITSKRTSQPTSTFLNTPEKNIGALKHIKKFSDFVGLQKMGEGAYGKVNLCIHKKERYIVVIKMIFKERILVDTWVRDRKLGTIPSEIQIMATLNKKPHENILRLLDFFEDDDYYYIETPVHGETGCIDLFDLIEFKTNMTEFEAKLIFKQVVAGIKHLHDQGIVHRDIKDENVIVDSKGFVKIIDFGSAAYVKSGPFDVFVGTIDYAAPEVLGGNPYEGQPQDIWAIGILLYTVVFKENPFYNIDEILEGDLKFNNAEEVSEDCIELIKSILNRRVPNRPTIDDINNDKWLII